MERRRQEKIEKEGEEREKRIRKRLHETTVL